MTAPDFDEAADYEAQAREFLARSRDYLAAGDLHQASEKAGARPAHMAKAVAVAQGWEYSNHANFSEVLYQARQMAGNPRIHVLGSVANDLHINYYKRKRHLNSGAISEHIESMAELLELLTPLTGLESGR